MSLSALHCMRSGYVTAGEIFVQVSCPQKLITNILPLTRYIQ